MNQILSVNNNKLIDYFQIQILMENLKTIIGHLSYIAQGSPFTLPNTYFYDLASNAIINYSAEGHKMDL